jgi:uncharacterized membrane protein
MAQSETPDDREASPSLERVTEQIRPKIENILDRLDVPDQPRDPIVREIAETIVEIETSHIRYTATPPEILASYKREVPGSELLVLDMEAKEQKHRHTWESRALFNDILVQSGGIIMGWLLALLAFGGSFALFWTDRAVGGTLFLSVPVILMIRNFLPHREPMKDARYPESADGRRSEQPKNQGSE